MFNRKDVVPKIDLRLVIRRFLVIFLPVAIVLAGILYVFYYTEVNNDRATIETGAEHTTNLMKDIIEREFQFVVSDLLLLTEHHALIEMLESGEGIWREVLATELLSFSAGKGLYDQVRFLDKTGMEVVRVNYNNGSPGLVPDEQLQFKAEHDYFKDTIVLEPDEVFISPLDLNIEHGEIEHPLKPIIRFGTPVFDSQGQKRGIVLLNYLAADMLHYLEEVSGEYQQAILLNSEGFWLKGLKPEDEWGFMYQDKGDLTFGNDYPEAWQKISASESGQFYNADGMITYETVYPLLEGQKSSTSAGKAFVPSIQRLEAEEYYWKLISYVSADVLNAVAGTVSGRLLLIYAAMMVLLAGSSWIVSRVSIRNKLVEERLRKAEKGLLDIVFQTSTDAMRLLDTDFNVIRVNPAMTTLSGLDPEAVIGKKCFEIFKKEICHTKECLLKRALETKVGASTEATIEKQDGTEVTCIVKATPIIDEYGVALGILEDFVDITERKRMEEALLESKSILAMIIDTAGDAIISVDDTQRIIRFNRIAQDMFGYNADEVMGKPLDILLPARFVKDHFAHIQKFMSLPMTLKPMQERAVLWHRRKDGTEFSSEVSISKLEVSGKMTFTAIIRDITERKRMEHDLDERMKEQKCLYGIGYIAERPRITLDELYQEAVNLLPSGWQYPEDTCARIATNDKEFKTENYRDTEWKQSSDITVDGVREGVVEVSYLEEKPELDEGPFTKEERLLIDAITERLALTIKRKQMKEDLEQKVEELQDAYRKLKELDRMKDNFLSTVSHELRTPLTSIKGFAEILLDYEEDRETQREFLTIINNESERLTRLIDDFLDLARIEAGRMNWQDTTVAIPETIEAASNATRALSAKKTLAVDITLEPDLPTIWGDGDRLVQVVTNLLSNAIKFTPEGGKIRVGAEVIKGSGTDDGSDVIRVSISDTGIGIAPEEYQTIFEKFKQAGDTLTDKPRGTGLGLPICKEIVGHYGGRIWVESEPGKGSTFYFTLPMKEKAEAEVPKVKEEKAAVAIKASRTILVVDDEAHIRRFLNHELTGRGYRVIEASGGREAIALAREHHPDLITLDVLMPDIDGLDVTAVLKSDPDTRDIPILIISVVEEKEKGYRLGVSDYIVKPFSKKVLMDRITQLLGQAQKTILVADADRALAKTIKSELEKRGFSVYVANDGAKALKVVESNRVDLIVLDTVMPKVDGYEVMKLLKGKPDTADIPIIVLTDVEINGGGVKALSMGAAEYVAKSGGLSKLFDGIENILSGKSTN